MLNIILLIISPALFSVRTDVLLCFIEFLSSFCWFPFALRVSLIPPSEISCNLFQWLRHAESLTKLSWNFWYPSQNFHGSFFSGSGAQSLWTSFCGKPEGPLRICMEAILLAQAHRVSELAFMGFLIFISEFSWKVFQWLRYAESELAFMRNLRSFSELLWKIFQRLRCAESLY